MRLFVRQEAVTLATVACAAIVAFTTLSCNVTGSMDSARSRDDQVAEAQDKMDRGDFQGAITELQGLSSQDDHSLQLLGAAFLGRGGANANKVDGALGAYNISTGNLTVIGNLANQLVPIGPDADGFFAQAVTTFGSMSNTDLKFTWIVYANLVRIAGLEARAVGPSATSVTRAGIGGSGCVSLSCASATDGNCPASGGGGISDTDASTASSALSSAASAANNTTLGTISNLINTISSFTGGSTNPTAPIMRCVLVNNTLSN